MDLSDFVNGEARCIAYVCEMLQAYRPSQVLTCLKIIFEGLGSYVKPIGYSVKERPAVADKPARRESMPKLLQFDLLSVLACR